MGHTDASAGPQFHKEDAIFATLAAVLVVVCAVMSAGLVLAVYRVEIHRPPSLRIVVFVSLWFLIVYGIVACAVHR